jgi:hypothetical protein
MKNETLSRAQAIRQAEQFETAARELRDAIALFDMGGGRKPVSATFTLPAGKQTFTTSAATTTTAPSVPAVPSFNPTVGTKGKRRPLPDDVIRRNCIINIG